MTNRPPCKVRDHIKDLFGRKAPESQIWIEWDIKRSLSLIWPIDTFEVIK